MKRFFVFVAVLVTLLTGIYIGNINTTYADASNHVSYSQYIKVKNELAKIKKDNSRLKAENATLKNQVQQNDWEMQQIIAMYETERENCPYCSSISNQK